MKTKDEYAVVILNCNWAAQLLRPKHCSHKEVLALVVSGAHPLKAIGKTRVAAFGLDGAICDPHQNNGTGPLGAKFVFN